MNSGHPGGISQAPECIKIGLKALPCCERFLILHIVHPLCTGILRVGYNTMEILKENYEHTTQNQIDLDSHLNRMDL